MNKREEERLRKQQEKLQKELERLETMRLYEKEYASCKYICGIDEVGRGPLAGPVVAGAVVLPADAQILYLKWLSPDQTVKQAKPPEHEKNDLQRCQRKIHTVQNSCCGHHLRNQFIFLRSRNLCPHQIHTALLIKRS